MGGKRRLFVIFACLLSLTACQQSYRTQGAPITARQDDNKVILMPFDVLLSEVTAGGMLEANAQWTEQAKINLRQGIRNSQRFGQLDLIEFPAPSPGSAEEKALTDFQRLHATVGRAIQIHSFVPAFHLPTKGDRLDWTLGEPARQLRAKAKARYALMIHMTDTYASPGRVALMVTSAVLFGFTPTGGTQVGFASLVDLESGHVVWFNRVSRNRGDLRSPEYAKETIDQLLLGLPLGTT